MSASIDVYFSFRSPYSYLAAPQLLQLADAFDVEMALRPVLPLAIRQPDFFSPENAKRARYISIDFPRRCAMLGMVCKWPSPDPVVQDLDSFEIAAEQPFIHQLSSLGVEANRRGRGVDFAYEASQLIFGGTKDWDKGDHMAQACARAALDLSAMERAVDAGREQGDHASALEANQAALETAGHWGVPTCVYKGAPFFGEDRIETLRWQLTKDGLAKTG